MWMVVFPNNFVHSERYLKLPFQNNSSYQDPKQEFYSGLCLLNLDLYLVLMDKQLVDLHYSKFYFLKKIYR